VENWSGETTSDLQQVLVKQETKKRLSANECLSFWNFWDFEFYVVGFGTGSRGYMFSDRGPN
jgi:hypothetical protein